MEAPFLAIAEPGLFSSTMWKDGTLRQERSTAIPLNAGRSGYVKAGYRLVELKKSQNDFLLKDALEGGYMEFGFIF